MDVSVCFHFYRHLSGRIDSKRVQRGRGCKEGVSKRVQRGRNESVAVDDQHRHAVRRGVERSLARVILPSVRNPCSPPRARHGDTMGCCSSYSAGGAHTLHNMLPGTELVKSPTRMVEGQMSFLKMDGDLFLDGLLLDATWFYNKALDPAQMHASLTKLLTLYPCLAARRSTTGLDMCNAGVAFSVQTLPGSARDHLNSEPRHGISLTCGIGRR